MKHCLACDYSYIQTHTCSPPRGEWRTESWDLGALLDRLEKLTRENEQLKCQLGETIRFVDLQMWTAPGWDKIRTRAGERSK